MSGMEFAGEHISVAYSNATATAAPERLPCNHVYMWSGTGTTRMLHPPAGTPCITCGALYEGLSLYRCENPECWRHAHDE